MKLWIALPIAWGLMGPSWAESPVPTSELLRPVLQPTEKLSPVEEATEDFPPETAKILAPPSTWLGVSVTKPDETLAAQVPDLPNGVGFLVRGVMSEGPAAAAGICRWDLIWKLNDQLLINEAQLAALLRLYEPGEKVKLALFRAGKPVVVEITLDHKPRHRRMLGREEIDAMMLPGESSPMRVLNLDKREASYSTADGSLLITRDGEVDHVTIRDPLGELIVEVDLTAQNVRAEGIPEEWRRRVWALRRGLDHALDGRMSPPRQPRPRVVPPQENP